MCSFFPCRTSPHLDLESPSALHFLDNPVRQQVLHFIDRCPSRAATPLRHFEIQPSLSSRCGFGSSSPVSCTSERSLCRFVPHRHRHRVPELLHPHFYLFQLFLSNGLILASRHLQLLLELSRELLLCFCDLFLASLNIIVVLCFCLCHVTSACVHDSSCASYEWKRSRARQSAADTWKENHFPITEARRRREEEGGGGGGGGGGHGHGRTEA